ncbi:MAG TPA: phytoene desaturase family protein, partial [Acidimicrobiales bacterium]|nr:phytoene desaturase family protein [Acidimicrobiales bacterium]
MRVVVVGAGLGGLAAAAYLLRDHHQVTVLEATERPGGRVGLIERDGFRLDTGPAVLTMPELLADVFAAAGAQMEDHLRLTPVDPMYRMVFADGSELRVRHGRPAMTEEIRAFSGPESAAAFERFADWLTALYHAEMPDFIDAQYDSAFDLLRRWRAALRLVRLGGFRRLGGRVASFFDDERLQRAFSFQSLYAGIAPSRALALYAVITYMDSVAGVWTPVGGMHAMASALAAAVEAGGATIRYDARVVRILRSGGGGAVTGVELADGAVLPTETVVCNADLPVAYRTLLEGVDAPRVARRGQYSPSCLLWVAGVRGRPPPGAAHHNVHIGREWDESFRAIIDDGVQMPDPSILVTLHSLDDATLAPPGCSTLYVLEPVPNLDGRVDWAAQRAAATRRLR